MDPTFHCSSLSVFVCEFGRNQIGLAWICAHDHFGKVSWHGRPVGLVFCPFFLIFGTLVPATTTHPKLVALVRNKQNMHGTWSKAHVIPREVDGQNGK